MQKNECGIQNEFNDGQQVGHRSVFRIPRSAFSLTEILIVIALIVLILAMSLPAFNFISGSRSIEAAQNEVSAFISQARASAVGLQERRGVLFYLDPATDREMMAMVHETPSKAADAATNPLVQVWIGLVPDTESVPLPKGVGIELANDPVAPASPASTIKYDRYIGFNALPNANPPQVQSPSDPQVGDVILFDGYGRLVSQYWGLRMTDVNASSGVMNPTGQLFFPREYAQTPTQVEYDQITTKTNTINVPRSSVAFILFDRNVAQEQWGSGFNTDPDFVQNNGISTAESNEETWLDSNSTPYCIDRFNGTLLKAQ